MYIWIYGAYLWNICGKWLWQIICHLSQMWGLVLSPGLTLVQGKLGQTVHFLGWTVGTRTAYGNIFVPQIIVTNVRSGSLTKGSHPPQPDPLDRPCPLTSPATGCYFAHFIHQRLRIVMKPWLRSVSMLKCRHTTCAAVWLGLCHNPCGTSFKCFAFIL